jgi:hypothetical protein
MSGDRLDLLARINQLEKALDKCISFICKDNCLDKANKYKPNYYMVCENCEHKKMCNVVIRGNEIKLKEWCLNDE